MNMNPELKKLWVEALRSGEYSQTRGMLKDAIGFCCLGVLCDVAVKTGAVSSKVSVSILDREITVSTGDEDGFLNSNECLGSDSRLATFFGLEREEAEELMSINDGDSTFLAIADAIESDMILLKSAD